MTGRQMSSRGRSSIPVALPLAAVASILLWAEPSPIMLAARSLAHEAPQQQPLPSFKVGVDYVNVDVTVTDQQGRPVEDLEPSAFEVYEDGKRQQVSAFSLVRIPYSPSRAAADRAALERIEPDVRTNEVASGGRVYILLLDDLHVTALRSDLVKKAARAFVERHLAANDLAAVLYTSGRADASQEFTSSASLLLNSIDKFMGRRLRSALLEQLDVFYARPDEETRADMRMRKIADPYALLRADQARSMLKTLTSVGDLLARSSAQRKAVILFSEGLDYDLQMGAVQTASGLTTMTNLDAPVLLQDFQQTIRASARANVSIYAVDPRGLAPTGEELIEVTSLPQNPLLGLTIDAFDKEVRVAQDSLRVLAEHTGGIAAVSSNDLAGAFDRIVADNSTYYLLGYRSTNPKLDGRFRKIEVRVARPGVRVRARSGYTAAPPKATESRLLTEAIEPSPALREAFNNPLPIAGLPLRAFAAPFQGEKETSVLVGVEVDARTFKFEEKDGLFTDTLEVAIVALDQQAKFKSGDRHRIDLRLKPSTHAAVRARGLRLLFRLTLPPGRFQLRAAAHESGADATGSVFYDLQVPDFRAAALAISGLVLTSSMAAEMPTARPDALLQNVLSTPPTAVRRFQPRESLSALFEVYGSAVSRSEVDIVTTVRGSDGRVLSRSESRGEGAAPGTAVARMVVPLPLEDVPAGFYTLAVEARDRTTPTRTASRTIPFEIAAAPDR